MLDKERLDILIENDYFYASDIVTKVLDDKLKVGENCLDDWLRLLDENTIDCFMNYCEKCLNHFGTMVDGAKEEENEILKDIICVVYTIVEMEVGSSDDIEAEDLVENIERLAIATSIEILRRSNKVKIIKKHKLSEKDSGLFSRVKKNQG
jgi:beta-glucosidase/6-phospho-beta-glucosidase/beta-galactosidase